MGGSNGVVRSQSVSAVLSGSRAGEAAPLIMSPYDWISGTQVLSTPCVLGGAADGSCWAGDFTYGAGLVPRSSRRATR